MRIGDGSSDVCSSDLVGGEVAREAGVDVLLAGPALPPGQGTPAPLNRGHAAIGRASCRQRVCQYLYISVVAVSLKPTYAPSTSQCNYQSTYTSRSHRQPDEHSSTRTTCLHPVF